MKLRERERAGLQSAQLQGPMYSSWIRVWFVTDAVNGKRIRGGWGEGMGKKEGTGKAEEGRGVPPGSVGINDERDTKSLKRVMSFKIVGGALVG